MVWARTTPGATRFLGDWVQEVLGSLKAGQQVLEDASLRALAQTMLPGHDGSLVRILKLQQVQPWSPGRERAE